MARHLIMGYYTCNLGHKHSTDNEMKQCNTMEQEKEIREHILTQENIENERIAEIAKIRERELEFEKEKMRQQERMKELELEKLRLEKESQASNTRSRVCVLS